MKIVIAGKPEKTEHYKAALEGLGAQTFCTLDCAEIGDADGLLLPGGDDIAPHFFGEENNGSQGIDEALDLAQFAMLSEFVNTGKPVFGICRGHQVLNVYFGGGLVQDLPTAVRHKSNESGCPAHETRAEEGSFVANIYGVEFVTNSAHHQGLSHLGRGLRAVQWACEDGVNEAICHESLPLYAVQWHPERMCFAHARPDTVDGSKVIQFFLDECARVAREQTAVSE